MSMAASSSLHGFTLIEILVVISVISILAVVVVLIVNPSEILKRSRDTQRLSDVGMIQSATNLYLADVGATGLGNASSVYVSIPDPAATSTAGSQCQGLGLPALPSGWNYHCAASSTYKHTDGTGWIPINLKNLSSGPCLSVWPADPINQTSTGFYYTYVTDGSKYEVNAILESQKYKTQYGTSPLLPYYPEVVNGGISLSLSPLWNPQGLVMYWNFDEKNGSTTLDASGNGNAGAWNGTPGGDGGTYYTAGKIGLSAGSFNGSTTYVSVADDASLDMTSALTFAAWIQSPDFNSEQFLFTTETGAGALWHVEVLQNGVLFQTAGSLQNGSLANLTNGAWQHVAVTYNGGVITYYINGLYNITRVYSAFANPSGSPKRVGVQYSGNFTLNGSMDDVRIYNRVLSAAEIQALYNAER